MRDCWLWDLVDCMQHEEEKIAGNTRDRGEKRGRARIRAGHFEPALIVQSLLKSADGAGLHRADIAQEAKSPLQRYRLLRKKFMGPSPARAI